MIPEQTPYASEVSALAHDANFKPIDYYLIPPWLDDTLSALKLSEAVLADEKKLETILTPDDIKFYNENLDKIYERKSQSPIPSDISLSFIYISEDLIRSAPSSTVTLRDVNSISVSEALQPFVRESSDRSPVRCWGIVARYEIHKLENSYLIGIRFESCNPESVLAEQAKEDQLLAEFHIGEFGLRNFSNTELFKKVLMV